METKCRHKIRKQTLIDAKTPITSNHNSPGSSNNKSDNKKSRFVTLDEIQQADENLRDPSISVEDNDNDDNEKYRTAYSIDDTPL